MNYEWSVREDPRPPLGTSSTTTHLSRMNEMRSRAAPACTVLCEARHAARHTAQRKECMLMGILSAVRNRARQR